MIERKQQTDNIRIALDRARTAAIWLYQDCRRSDYMENPFRPSRIDEFRSAIVLAKEALLSLETAAALHDEKGQGESTMIERINSQGTIEGLSFDHVLVTPNGAETIFGRTMKVYSVEFKDENGATVKSFDRLDRKTINDCICSFDLRIIPASVSQ